jgi:hypothetical protein
MSLQSTIKEAPQEYVKSLQEMFLAWVNAKAETAGSKERQKITDDYRDLMEYLREHEE